MLEGLLLALIIAWLIVMLKEGIMPVATTSGEETFKYELKSLEGGYVVLRKLTYGEWLHRRQMSSNMSFKGGRSKDDFEGVMQLVNERATHFEFAKCVVDHNLTDENDNPLNFAKPDTLKRLDSKIGEEISLRISKLNQFDEDLDEEDFELESSG